MFSSYIVCNTKFCPPPRRGSVPAMGQKPGPGLSSSPVLTVTQPLLASCPEHMISSLSVFPFVNSPSDSFNRSFGIWGDQEWEDCHRVVPTLSARLVWIQEQVSKKHRPVNECLGSRKVVTVRTWNTGTRQAVWATYTRRDSATREPWGKYLDFWKSNKISRITIFAKNINYREKENPPLVELTSIFGGLAVYEVFYVTLSLC